MPEININLVVRSLRGKVGDIVVKLYRHGPVITKIPDMSGIRPSSKQKKRRTRFSKAAAYAQSILADPKKLALYRAKLRGRKSVYHAAISEFLRS